MSYPSVARYNESVVWHRHTQTHTDKRSLYTPMHTNTKAKASGEKRGRKCVHIYIYIIYISCRYPALSLLRRSKSSCYCCISIIICSWRFNKAQDAPKWRYRPVALLLLSFVFSLFTLSARRVYLYGSLPATLFFYLFSPCACFGFSLFSPFKKKSYFSLILNPPLFFSSLSIRVHYMQYSDRFG